MCEAKVVAELAIMVLSAPTPLPPTCAMHLAQVISASPAHRCISPKAGPRWHPQPMRQSWRARAARAPLDDLLGGVLSA